MDQFLAEIFLTMDQFLAELDPYLDSLVRIKLPPKLGYRRVLVPQCKTLFFPTSETSWLSRSTKRARPAQC